MAGLAFGVPEYKETVTINGVIYDFYKIIIESVLNFALVDEADQLAFHTIYNILKPYDELTNSGCKLYFIFQRPWNFNNGNNDLAVFITSEIENVENRILIAQQQQTNLTPANTLKEINILRIEKNNVNSARIDLEIIDALNRRVAVTI